VWQYSQVTAKNPVPTWLLAIGGVGIAFGLATCKHFISIFQILSHLFFILYFSSNFYFRGLE
jgi:hypothetical protein